MECSTLSKLQIGADRDFRRGECRYSCRARCTVVPLYYNKPLVWLSWTWAQCDDQSTISPRDMLLSTFRLKWSCLDCLQVSQHLEHQLTGLWLPSDCWLTRDTRVVAVVSGSISSTPFCLLLGTQTQWSNSNREVSKTRLQLFWKLHLVELATVPLV